MPATTTTTTVARKRFELPSLDFKFASLTEGTDIPPPLPSPVEEKVPELKLNDGTKKTAAADKGAAKGSNNAAARTTQPPSSPSHSMVRSLKRAADDVPPSPTLSRPGSIRRLFSRNLLNASYAHGEGSDSEHHHHHHSAGSILRPDSRSTGSIVDERKARRSSGWFRRLRGSDSSSSASSASASTSPTSKRMTMVFEEEKTMAKPVKPAGPPPPMIPELGQLKSKVDLNDDGSLGADLFKSIS